VRNKLLLLLAPFALLACETTPPPEPEPRIVTVEVPVPTPAPCVPRDLPPAPEYLIPNDATLAGAADAAARYQLLYADWLLRRARLGQLEPIVAACPRE
jgi:hypothetical protein